MTFRVGQKVVCVNDDVDAFIIPTVSYADCTLDGLTKGEIYTIKGVIWCRLHQHWSVTLEEIDRGINEVVLESGAKYREEGKYAAARFRPVQEQGMSILRAIAANPKQKITEAA